jgi:hypothetical protein
MSAVQLSPRKTRRIARATGLDVLRAWGAGGYVFAFVTADHRHGQYDSKTGTWCWDEDTEPLWAGHQPTATHYYSCRELFPEYAASMTAQSRG